MSQYHLAIDIGASSGRHILGWLSNEKLITKEIYRFENNFSDNGSHKVWDVEKLFSEIKNGLKECAKQGTIPSTVGLDTWGVDYVLLDTHDCILGDAISYWDTRTEGIADRVFREYISEKELYARTGTQVLVFNTIFQLMAEKFSGEERLWQAKHLLMLPDYLNFLLTGFLSCEYTDASTTGLLTPAGEWDRTLIDMLGLPQHIFGELILPGRSRGFFRDEIQKIVGFNAQVIAVASHDTGSAVAAVPFLDDDAAFISSGTWSLLGKEIRVADSSEQCRQLNFTNEGGYGGRIRFLTNIMGLWMIESVRRELPEKIPYDLLCEMADHSSVDTLLDCNDPRFLAPRSMIETIKSICLENGQAVPVTTGDIARVIYRSLANTYARRIASLEGISGRPCSVIHIVGGGSRASYLNELTAKATRRRVLSGPVEATAIGNLAVQMIGSGELQDLAEARKMIYKSFEIKEYLP